MDMGVVIVSVGSNHDRAQWVVLYFFNIYILYFLPVSNYLNGKCLQCVSMSIIWEMTL